MQIFGDITDTVVIYICYKLFFSLKRIQLQIDPKYKTVHLIVEAMQRQFKFEIILLSLFILGELIQFLIVLFSISGFGYFFD